MPSIVNVAMWKKRVGGTGGPVTLSMSSSAFGPCSSYRYRVGFPARTIELPSRSKVTS